EVAVLSRRRSCADSGGIRTPHRHPANLLPRRQTPGSEGHHLVRTGVGFAGRPGSPDRADGPAIGVEADPADADVADADPQAADPVATSTRMTSPQAHPVARVLPSALKARLHPHEPRRPGMACRSRPVATSHTFTTPTDVVPATSAPSGENATARTWDFDPGR